MNIEIIIGLTIGLVFFIATISAYTTGLKHGKQLSNNQVPKVNLNPVKAIVQAVEQHEQKKEASKEEEQLEDVFNYSRESALKAIKKGDI